MKKDEKVCGNCKFIIPHRKNKFGFEGDCEEMVKKAGLTDAVSRVHVIKTLEGCEYFTPKDK